MNIYNTKQWWKLSLFLLAIIIGVSSLMYTNKVVEGLSIEERKKVELWAEASKQLIESETSDKSAHFLLKIIQGNTTIPVIVVDSNDNIKMLRNIDSTRINETRYLEKQLAIMKEYHEPIIISSPDIGLYQLLYYNQSIILSRLRVYPYLQLTVILLFILISYFAFSTSRKAEQNKVWVGMSKETAHQLGTPISSLMAWLELFKARNEDKEFIKEFEKDVIRLEKITDRFSKIGSKPTLKNKNVVKVINRAVDYLRSRASNSVIIEFHHPEEKIYAPLNESLFEWVIENICKNAMDAIKGIGSINITIKETSKTIVVDIADSGKGIPKSKQKTIFKPGYTTKKRGWGLGLSLTKRIIEENHRGKIFVLHSEIKKGTTIRIIIKKS